MPGLAQYYYILYTYIIIFAGDPIGMASRPLRYFSPPIPWTCMPGACTGNKFAKLYACLCDCVNVSRVYFVVAFTRFKKNNIFAAMLAHDCSFNNNQKKSYLPILQYSQTCPSRWESVIVCNKECEHFKSVWTKKISRNYTTMSYILYLLPISQ